MLACIYQYLFGASLSTIFPYNTRLEAPLDRSIFRDVKSPQGHNRPELDISLQIIVLLYSLQ
jgi:hypothetical protein